MTSPYHRLHVAHAVVFALFLTATVVPAASQGGGAAQAPNEELTEEPAANPGRPTVSTPATLTPAGYLQFETGFLGAWTSPEVSSQSSINEVVKFSVAPRLELLAGYGPFAHSRVGNRQGNGKGGVALGLQGILHRSEGARPTIALSYFRSVYGGDTPDLDIGSYRNSALVLASGDIKGFHYDTNFLFNEVINVATHRDPRKGWPLWRTLAFYSAISPRQCCRKPLGGQLQRPQESGLRRRL